MPGETGVRASVDSSRLAELTARRLLQVYGRKAMDKFEADSLRSEKGLLGFPGVM